MMVEKTLDSRIANRVIRKLVAGGLAVSNSDVGASGNTELELQTK